MDALSKVLSQEKGKGSEREQQRNTEDKQLLYSFPLQTKSLHISKQVLITTAKTFCTYTFLP